MVEIGRTIVSRDIFEEHFLCDLLKCKGACCVDGDSGAPLMPDEAAAIEANFSHFADLLPEEHIREIERQGFSVTDKEGDLVTPLVRNEQCAYAFHDAHGILKCSIEQAYRAGKGDFHKPVSCHLFPIRITEYKRFDAVNYQQLDSCKPGRLCGSANKLPLYSFLKEPLIRRYGAEWYHQVELAAEYLKK